MRRVEEAALREMARRGGVLMLCGLDVAPSNVGVALGEVSVGVATPLRTLWRRTGDEGGGVEEELVGIIRERGVGGLVVGWPLELDGSLSRQCFTVKRFVAGLSRQMRLAQPDGPEIPFVYWDERFSTVAVIRNFRAPIRDEHQKIPQGKDFKKNRKKFDRRPHDEDARAAAFILQGFLSSIQFAID